MGKDKRHIRISHRSTGTVLAEGLRGWNIDKGDDEASRRSLIRVGLERIEGFAHKGMPACVDAGLEFTRTAQLSTKEVAERNPATRVLDVRSENEWSNGHIRGARQIPLGELKERMRELAKDADLIAVCGSGYSSSIAASLLQANGFTRIRSMDGGMAAWNQHKFASQHELTRTYSASGQIGPAKPRSRHLRSR